MFIIPVINKLLSVSCRDLAARNVLISEDNVAKVTNYMWVWPIITILVRCLTLV